AIKDVRASQRALVDLFDRIECFFRRFEIYVNIQPTQALTDILVGVMAEVLSILGTVTKEIGERLWRTPVEDALQRLDRLTQEEALMAAAENMKITRGIDNRVKAMQENWEGVSQGIQTIDLKLQGTNDKLQGFGDTLHDVDSDLSSIIEGIIIGNDDRINFRSWMSPESPPADPSINYNAACEAHHEGTAAWCTQSNTFADWKASGSLLWIHGKRTPMSDAGSAHMAYFYFDFRVQDTGKQDSRALLSSLLVQLSGQSDQFYRILHDLYSKHQNGTERPLIDSLAQCLKDMLSTAGQVPVYLILDALDECPADSGMPPPREKVLDLVEELVELRHPNLRLCITSRQEYDISTVLELLATQKVILHDERGQKKDIIDYVNFFVRSNKRMKKWSIEDQDMVIEKLAEKADGMFKWVSCQLGVLQHCFPIKLRRALEELPESLDETYEHILKGIGEANRRPAHRLLQCLTVAARPLRVEELAEVLAIGFNAGGTDTGWRWEDQKDAVLIACSSLVSVITDGSGDQVVQFSHFSVKEFLISGRLAHSTTKGLFQFHISLESAHAILAHACLSVLLRL
ncbi:hypothetical protein EDB83DRAFT_2184135, partial [Lactarius deliciosus]